MPYKTFVAGEEALAADVNTYLMSQTVPRFPSTAARDAAITAPIKGQLCIIDTTPNEQLVYNGTAWVTVGWSLVRWLNASPALPVGINSANAFEFPALSIGRAATMVVQVNCYVTTSVSGAQSAGIDFIANAAGVAPTVAPITAVNIGALSGITIPATAIWRNQAASAVLTPKVRITC